MRSLKKDFQWSAHPGRRASLRNLRQLCHGILARIDQPSVDARARAYAPFADEQFPEFETLKLLFRASECEAETGRSWIESVDVYVREIEAERIERNRAKIAATVGREGAAE